MHDAPVNRTTPPGPAGLIIAIVVNLVGLAVLHAHGWWRPWLGGVITERFEELLWVANLTALVQVAGNLVLLRWWTRLPRAVVNLAFSTVGLFGLLVTWSVFPFDVARFGSWAEPGLRLVFGLALLGAFIGGAAQTVRLVVELGRRVRHAVNGPPKVVQARVVYESMFGNTRDVAIAIAKGLRRVSNVEVAVSEVGEAAKTPCDLLVLGGPVHAWSLSRSVSRKSAHELAAKEGRDVVSRGPGLREFLREVPKTHEAFAATFDTALKSSWFPVGSAAGPAARVLDELGYDLVSRPEHFRVTQMLGPLERGELERAEAWGEALASRCTRHVASGTMVTLHE